MKLKKLKVMLLLFGFSTTLIFAYAPSTSAFDLFGIPCSRNTDKTNDSAVCKSNDAHSNDTGGTNAAVNTINTAANIVASVTGVAAVIMIIYGGFSYITAGGNSEQATNGRRRIINALIGLVVVALAWTITKFVLDRLL